MQFFFEIFSCMYIHLSVYCSNVAFFVVLTLYYFSVIVLNCHGEDGKDGDENAILR